MTFLDDQDLPHDLYGDLFGDLHGEPEDELSDGRDAVLRHLDRLTAGRVAQAVDSDQERVLRACIEPGWQQAGTCGSADPEAWFPEKSGHVNPVVRVICVECPVRRSCLATAVLFAELGTWAGTSPIDRRPAFRALRDGADPAQALEEMLAHQEATAGRRTHFKTQRWSGKPTSVGQSKNPDSALGAPRRQDTGQRSTSQASQAESRVEQGPEAA